MTTQAIFAVDPGNEQSAFVLFDGFRPIDFGILPNREMLVRIDKTDVDCIAIEGIASYGMPVGREVFDTCLWIGRFIERHGGQWSLIYRADVKLHLCHSMRAKDPMVRQALIDRFGPGREVAIGTKKAPGPCYGMSSHCWSALAVAVTWWDTLREKSP